MSTSEAAPSTSEAAAPAEKKMIVLRSSDGELFEVEERIVMLSQTIKNMVEDCDDSLFPLPNVTSPIMAKVIEYCRRHVEAGEKPQASNVAEHKDDDLTKFDEEFVKVEMPVMYELILAANYLNIKSMLDLTCKTVAELIRGKSTEAAREILMIGDPGLTDQELENIRKENQWAFE